MTDAPERIWADGDETGLEGFCDWSWVRGSWNRSKEGVGEVEYVRADLVEALEAENQRLRGVLETIATTGRCEFAVVRAALRSTETSHD